MGGNLFKEYNVQRINNDTLEIFKDIISTFHKEFFNDLCFLNIVPSYREKETHGDIDVVYTKRSSYDTVSVFVEWYAKKYQNGHDIPVYKNGPVTSACLIIDGKLVQVDFIGCKNSNFSLKYFSWNDLGNLIGRVAYNHGLKFGHEGLFAVHRGVTKNEILLTSNFERAIEYLGFDSKRFKQGFNNLQEIFEYVENSKKFSVSYYDLELRSHIARVRDKKRTTYSSFLEYLKQKYPEHISVRTSNEEKHQRMLDAILEFEQEPTYYNIIARELVHKEYCKKFNGTIVKDLTRLSGKELGDMISRLKNDTILGNEVITSQMSENEVKKVILSMLNDIVA